TGDVRSDVAADDLASGLIGIFLALLAAGLRFGLGDSTAVLSGVLVSLHAAVVPGRSAAL
ncbi:MAG TPA: hypothetical protein VFP61_07825, partial [Acidimicrobiales bacterium]|nr:hypothetical protein [Acidimicrobiales bacterium]